MGLRPDRAIYTKTFGIILSLITISARVLPDFMGIGHFIWGIYRSWSEKSLGILRVIEVIWELAEQRRLKKRKKKENGTIYLTHKKEINREATRI